MVPLNLAVCIKMVLALYLESNSRGFDEISYNYLAAEVDVESTKTITVVCTIL